MESGAKGCEVIVSGKLRAQRAKAMKFKDGYMISSGHPAVEYIDGCVRHVMLRQGVLGIKASLLSSWMHDMLGNGLLRCAIVRSCHVVDLRMLHARNAPWSPTWHECFRILECLTLVRLSAVTSRAKNTLILAALFAGRTNALLCMCVDVGAHHEGLGPKWQARTQNSST